MTKLVLSLFGKRFVSKVQFLTNWYYINDQV